MEGRRSILIETTIKEVLHKAYTEVKDNSKLKDYESNTPLELMIYHDNPFYLTDGQTCVMFQFVLASAPQNLNKISPYNNVRTNYYNTFQGCYKVFDCSNAIFDSVDITEPFPLPYSPFFHFKQRFEEFGNERTQKLKQTTECRIIRIQSWKLNIVNIANTGFLAPIICVLKYTMKLGIRIKNAEITSILYDPFTRKRMLSYYNELLRQYKHPSVTTQSNQNTNFQLCVFITSQKTPSNFLNVDLRNNILQGPTNRTPANERLVLLSNTAPGEGQYYLKQPLGHITKSLPRIPVFSQQSRNRLNEAFFADLAERCSSEDSDDPLKDYHQPQQRDKEVQMESSQEESVQDDNILRKLYKKMLEKDKAQIAILNLQNAIQIQQQTVQGATQKIEPIQVQREDS